MSETGPGDGGDFLDAGVHADSGHADSADGAATEPPGGAPPAAPAPPPPPLPPPSPPHRRLPAAVVPVLLVLAGMVVGGLVVAAWHSGHHDRHDAARLHLVGDMRDDHGFGYGGPMPGPGMQHGGQMPGFGGGMPGQFGGQLIQGTLTSIGTSSVTVRSDNGTTATYQLDAATLIVKNGQRVALSALKTGDTVYVHVDTSNGRTTADHVFDGAPPGR